MNISDLAFSSLLLFIMLFGLVLVHDIIIHYVYPSAVIHTGVVADFRSGSNCDISFEDGTKYSTFDMCCNGIFIGKKLEIRKFDLWFLVNQQIQCKEVI